MYFSENPSHGRGAQAKLRWATTSLADDPPSQFFEFSVCY